MTGWEDLVLTVPARAPAYVPMGVVSRLRGHIRFSSPSQRVALLSVNNYLRSSIAMATVTAAGVQASTSTTARSNKSQDLDVRISRTSAQTVEDPVWWFIVVPLPPMYAV